MQSPERKIFMCRVSLSQRVSWLAGQSTSYSQNEREAVTHSELQTHKFERQTVIHAMNIACIKHPPLHSSHSFLSHLPGSALE